MENNLSQKVNEVLSATPPVTTPNEPRETLVRESILVRPGVVTMPKTPHKSFFKKPIFIVLMLIVLLIVLTSIFTLFNLGRFKKPVPYVHEPMSEAEYNQLVERLTAEGFFNSAQIKDDKLKELQKEYESNEEYRNPPITDATRQNISALSGTKAVVQENQ